MVHVAQELLAKAFSDVSQEVAAKFFTKSPAQSSRRKLNQGVNPACQFNTSHIPVMARAQNLQGKWKYLLQDKDNSFQYLEVRQRHAYFFLENPNF